MSEMHPTSLAPGVPELTLLGVRFASLSLPDVLARLDLRPPDAPFSYVVTPNADHLVRLARDITLAPLYVAAGLTLLDSRVVARLGRLFGLTVPPVVTGSDLTALLWREVVRPGDRIAVIGGRVAAVRALAAQYGIADLVHHDPPMGFEQDRDAFDQATRVVRDARARFTFFAVGSPRQERLAYAVRDAGGASGIGLCIGASLDFLTGAQTRAPIWMQRAELEWLYRLTTNPRRLARRYLMDDLPIVALLAREAYRRR